MTWSICMCIFGYLAGSILFYQLAVKIFHKNGVVNKNPDQNPGVFNAFRYGGFWSGLFCLAGDLTKGFLPIWIYLHHNLQAVHPDWIPLVMLCPVLGHLFPIWNHFRGGKGIAVTFGVLLGLIPYWPPVLILAALFLFFVLVVHVSPDYIMTICVYVLLPIVGLLLEIYGPVLRGMTAITLAVLFRLAVRPDLIESIRISLPWMKFFESDHHVPELQIPVRFKSGGAAAKKHGS